MAEYEKYSDLGGRETKSCLLARFVRPQDSRRTKPPLEFSRPTLREPTTTRAYGATSRLSLSLIIILCTVDPELFERVTGRLGTVAARGRNAGRSPTSVVAGVAKCARCGSTVLRVSKGKPPKARYTYLVCSKAHARAKGCEYQPVRYDSVEEALRTNARAIVESAPRGADTGELEEKIEEQNDIIDALVDEQRFLVDEVIKYKSAAMRRALREKELELKKAAEELTRMRQQRDATASSYVIKRLAALQQALERKPFSIAEANSALKQAVQAIALDPEGSLKIHWHHSDVPTADIPFWSRHAGFENEQAKQTAPEGK